MKVDRTKLNLIVDGLKKEAEVNSQVALSAEDIFNNQLLEKKAGYPDLEAIGEQIAAGILKSLEKEAEASEDNTNGSDEVIKKAGVNDPNLVASKPGVEAPDAGDPQLGKTVTTTNEVEKGLVAKGETTSVAAIIEALTPGKGVGPSTTEIQAPQITLTKRSEHEKRAAEQIVSNLFEKFASVSTEEEKAEAVDNIVKYATAAEEILEDKLGDNYNATDVEKVAERLILNDIQAYNAQMAKEAEAQEFGYKVAEAFLERLDQVGQEQIQKQAEAEDAYITKAAEMLETKVGKGNFSNEDIIKVAEALIESDSKKSAADRVIAEL